MAVPALLRLWCRALVCVAGLAACHSDNDRGVNSSSAVVAESGVSAVDPATEAAKPGDSVISGTITYAQRIALPRDAVVDVRVYDLARSGTPAGLIAERSFPAGGQVPIRFEVSYDSARLRAGAPYGVQARILVDGALWFINPDPVPLGGRGSLAGVEVRVRPASAKE